jgi:hypothetical protein
MAKTNDRSPKYVFLHLFVFALLYLSVVSFITLLFQYITILFPDQLQGYLYGSYDSIRWTSSTLLVCYPTFLGLSWLLQRDMRKEPSLREMRIRKWLLSLTLFVSAITVIVDLIQVVYRFYGGEITTQFFLKLLTVMAVAGVVFGYYFWEYRREDSPSRMPKMFGWATGAAVVIAIVSGFFIAGSPSEQRGVRFDEQRVSDLQSLQAEVIAYWQQHDALPADLTELNNSLSGYTVAVDPELGTHYEYHVTGELNFQLCAEFDTESTADASKRYPDYAMGGVVGTNWNHGGGRVCFERTIDPAVLKPLTKE